MAVTVQLQSSWSAGMRRDLPRSRMPQGSSWNMVDLIPDLGAPNRKRGGWGYASPALSASAATGSTYVSAVKRAPFTAGAKLCAVTDDAKLVTIASDSSATLVGSAVAAAQNPVFHSQKLILPSSDGTTAPKYYDGTTLGNLAGSPPAGKYATVYADRTVLAHTAANPERIYFSGASDPTSWDTTNSWRSFISSVTGLAALPGALLVFQSAATSRVRGATPPPGSDQIVDDPLFTVGCTDARSIVVTGAYAIFANPLGVYRTNGTAFPEDLTKQCGISSYWQSVLASYSSTWTLAAGIYRNYYVISVMDGSTFKDAFMFDLSPGKYAAYRVSNLKALCFDNAVTVGEELYFGLRSASRVGKLSTIFSPSATYKNDADGTAVAPVWETTLFGGDNKRKTWRSVIVDFDMRDSASDNPTIQIAYVANPEDSYTDISSGSGGLLSETTNKSRKRVLLNVPSDAIALRFTQANASSDTRFYGLSADVHAREGSRLS